MSSSLVGVRTNEVTLPLAGVTDPIPISHVLSRRTLLSTMVLAWWRIKADVGRPRCMLCRFVQLLCLMSQPRTGSNAKRYKKKVSIVLCYVQGHTYVHERMNHLSPQRNARLRCTATRADVVVRYTKPSEIAPLTLLGVSGCTSRRLFNIAGCPPFTATSGQSTSFPPTSQGWMTPVSSQGGRLDLPSCVVAIPVRLTMKKGFFLSLTS